MTIEQIERSIANEPNRMSRISLKARTIEGIFIKAHDFEELKKKNFWRIVNVAKAQEYKKTRDLNLSRIFNGQEMSRIASFAE